MKLGLIGAGNMASALARGIGEPVLVADVDAAKAQALAAELGGEAVASNAELAERADVVVLCHKPKQLAEVAEQVGGHAQGRRLDPRRHRHRRARGRLSGRAGLPLHPEHPRRGAPGRALLRARPAAPARGRKREILELFGRAGAIIPLDSEPLIEPAMALMSCGPAFMALVAESFADAGAAHGLERDEALRMTVETMAGTAAYLREHDYDTEAVKVRVATPGGTTERGLIALEERGLRDVCRAAVDAVVEATR